MAEAQSPKEASAPSQKRPLEEPSSPSGPADAPEAKRPALDKVIDTAAPQESDQSFATQTSDAPATSATEVSDTAASTEPAAAKSTSTVPPISAVDAAPVVTSEPVPAQPAPLTTTSNGTHDSYRAEPQSAASHHAHQDETSWLHLRAIISSAEAATVIGKGGENVSQIRRLAGAKCTVSEYTRGAVERILTVSGPVDAVAKAFGLIIRTLNQEPLDQPSTPQSKTYPLRLLVPHVLIGSIIGKGGVRIREIQEASGARLNASEACLPLSTERSLVVLGVADAIHIAAYYVGSTLVEQLTERFGGPAASAYASRHGSSQGAMPGGMQVAPYVPMAAGGQVGHPDYRKQMPLPNRAPAPHAYGMPYMPQGQPAPSPYGAGSPRAPYAAAAPQQSYSHMQQQPVYNAPAQPMHNPNQGGQAITQQIYIPNDMVGAIIGKGGAKINEIRQLSGSVIKINEPQDNSNERLVTVTGTQECNQMALYMLYQRLGESSKNSNSIMPR